jgi:MFS family permease
VNCWNAAMIAQLAMFFVLRFFVAMQYSVAVVYVTELYPMQVASLGLSFGLAVSCIPNIFLSVLINYLDSINFPVMIIFCLSAICFMLVLPFTRETYGEHPQEMI